MKAFLFIIVAALATSSSLNSKAAENIQIKYPTDCILKTLAKEMKVTLTSEIPLPRIVYSSQTSLAEFNRAMKGQWAEPSELITNAYSFSQNTIFLYDEGSFYKRLKRFIDDSLAHELVHYIQYRYRNTQEMGDSEEMEAISYQSWFRKEVFINQSIKPCDE